MVTKIEGREGGRKNGEAILFKEVVTRSWVDQWYSNLGKLGRKEQEVGGKGR